MKLKSIVIIILLFLFQITSESYAIEVSEEVDIDGFLNSAKEYAGEVFPELENENILEMIISGGLFENENLIQRILSVFTKEIKTSISLVLKIISVSILCSLLKSIQAHNESSVSEVAFYICYLFVVTLVINSYIEIAMLCSDTMTKLNDFMNILTPLILTLLVANGSIASVTIMQPVLILMTNITNTLITKIILPIIFISMVINIIENISDNIDVSRLPSILQKTSVWTVNFILGIFIGILSLEGTLSANVDGLTAKTAKTVVSTVIPVVGKALSDATDSIIGAASITKNALGIVGVIAIVGTVCIPIIKAFVMMFIYNISAALIEPLVDKRMTKCIADAGNAIKIIFALMSTVSILFIISITLMIKVGNFTMMYR